MTLLAATSPSTDSVWAIILLVLYFVPWMVAKKRQHMNENAIAVLNLFLGWTFIGWVVALVWACTSNVRARS